MTNLPPTHQDVLCLLSQALHAARQPESTSRALNNHPDWPAILREAAQQAVLPLVLEAALTLPPEQQPPGGVLAIYRDQAIRQAIHNERLMAAQDVILAAFARQGIPCAILKGASVACFYPQPSLREMGDIDLLTYPVHLDQAAGLLTGLGYSKAPAREDFHLGFVGPRAQVELHFIATEYPEGPAGRHLREAMEGALPAARVQRMDGYSFPALSPPHQAISLLIHTQRHMMGLGIGLRHLCDFAMFLNSLSPAAWQADIAPLLKQGGLLQFARVLARACVLYLGLPAAQAPWSAQVDDRLAHDLLMDFLDSGNFGHKRSTLRATAVLVADKAGTGRPAGMLRTALRNINTYARKRYPAAQRWPALLPLYWLYVPACYLVTRWRMGEGAAARQTLVQARQRKRLFDQLRIYLPDEKA